LSLGDPIEVYRFDPRFLRSRCLYHAQVLESYVVDVDPPSGHVQPSERNPSKNSITCLTVPSEMRARRLAGPGLYAEPRLAPAIVRDVETPALANEQKLILRAMFKGDLSAFPLEEIAASASISFEQAWYAVLELLQLRFLTPSGLGFYALTEKGREAAFHTAKCCSPVHRDT
jgi:hypothetical protein